MITSAGMAAPTVQPSIPGATRKMEQFQSQGSLTRVAGAVVTARNLPGVRVYDMVRVGHQGFLGEVIRLQGEEATIQIYEDATGLRIGEPVVGTGSPLTVELGPGLLGAIYDGLQRPLQELFQRYGPWLARGLTAPALSRDARWTFQPQIQVGHPVEAGDILGVVQETETLAHRILTPPGVMGRVVEIQSGQLAVDAVVAQIERSDGVLLPVTLMQRWPVRRARPIHSKLAPDTPLMTGQRVIDVFFPIADGGAAIIPGGFGTGKTVMEQSLTKWVNADVVVYIGCGERGNEMTEVLAELPRLQDPHTGASLMQRTILIANTSNMPVAAREASVYTGITMAEYYRDMGYSVALLADSTSRWGEALREVSGRLEEMPGEEGYPAYLNTRIADFYERSGRVESLGCPARQGSVTVVGAVSPPGGDFSDPITQASLRVAGVFWGLDTGLARRRHFPAINWRTSYSLYTIQGWFDREIGADWSKLTAEAMALLEREEALQETVQLVGADALPASEQVVLAVARHLREDFLQQSAFDPVDAFCPPRKSYLMLGAILQVGRWLQDAVEQGRDLEELLAHPQMIELSDMKRWPLTRAEIDIPQLVGRIVGKEDGGQTSLDKSEKEEPADDQ